MKYVFVHPDLGIGGAERLIIDAAIGLQNEGHKVVMVTNQYSPSHCFKETELLEIETVVDYIPRSILGKFHALLAYLKIIIAAIYVCVYHKDADVVISDQVSVGQIVLKPLSKARLIFYCHFPDLLLTDRKDAGKKVYRAFLDLLEAWSTGLADYICVNSEFTAGVVRETFPHLALRELVVLHPPLNMEFFDAIEVEKLSEDVVPTSANYIFTSVNRYEAKKRIDVAIEAFHHLKNKLSDEEFEKCHLVIAGGFDPRNGENEDVLKKLVKLADELDLPPSKITFLKSPTDTEKINLIRSSTAVLYTPDREHFGIVPIEAMYLGTPVIAVNSGGPKETVVPGKTGFLVEQTPDDFADAMVQLIRDSSLLETMSENGTKRVRQNFGTKSFITKLIGCVENC